MGSRWYLDREKRDSASGTSACSEARSRLDAARRERDSLQESSDVFRTLVDRGLLQGERRLDMVELVNALRTRHQLSSLDYEIEPAAAAAARGRARLRLRRRAREPREPAHAGAARRRRDRLRRGARRRAARASIPLDRCALRRLEVSGPESLAPRVEAECAFEWITLKDKNANRPA